MAKQLIDCRGLSCPQPVVRTKKALEQFPAAELEVLLDNEIAAENVARFARSRCWVVANTLREGEEIRLTLEPGSGESCDGAAPDAAGEEKVLV
ncbi:MAG: sulfurtransferase TusA family protein, partial [Deltaproteobacteria bacterium]|nr:sulfurtransferase TusA family protein [Deltaproteobacteria bacterium]